MAWSSSVILPNNGSFGSVAAPPVLALFAVELLLEDSQLAKQVGECARQDAFSYDVESTVEKFQEIYRRLVAR